MTLNLQTKVVVFTKIIIIITDLAKKKSRDENQWACSGFPWALSLEQKENAPRNARAATQTTCLYEERFAASPSCVVMGGSYTLYDWE